MTGTGRNEVVDEKRGFPRGWPSAAAFRSFLSERLGEEWTVRIVAQRSDREEGGNLFSVAALASRSDEVRLHIAHDRGSDVVFLSFGDEPEVPFEDLAVAKGEIATGDLIDLAIQALKKPPGKTAFTLETTLRLIREWSGDLARDLHPKNRSMARQLKEISEEFGTGIRLYP